MFTKAAFDNAGRNFISLLPYKETDSLPPLPFEELRDKDYPTGVAATDQRIHFICRHHFQLLQESDREVNEIRDIELLTSRLADREMQEGELMRLSDGIFYVEKLFIGGGAYVALLQDVEESQPPKIVCRGTANRRGATENRNSLLNDLEFEMGSMGVQTIWPSLKDYLGTTQRVKVYGKSLGGAHAQQLAVLIQLKTTVKVEKLTTLGSVGAGDGVNQAFMQNPFDVHIIRNRGDLIPCVGGVHIGHNATGSFTRKVTYLTPEGESLNPAASPSISAFFSSLGEIKQHFFCKF